MTDKEFVRASALVDEFRKMLNSDTMQIALGVMRESVMQDVAKYDSENLKGYARYHDRFISLAVTKSSTDVPDDFNPEN